ncbi:malto-oligosyltrehalose synthase [Virgisporangium aliadipatigenens]|uniref:Malto-oligosyltrehalose synthase n=1 Tax=Virgisporangium aliadipatigenens TaxID=741659 RepID=A0A8J3YVT5_9ACTN|nr:malto-oligosyltrehalose synthase [Virgisporangium aliadipatigenens]GIJ51572.1 malto-oligosyltrehalose synthase [Virgisporangium aliadipatigenens]
MADSTYRIQVSPSFPLSETAGVVDYLRDLGVTRLYTSPLLTATPGSQHGYDVVDHSSVNPEIGGEEGRLTLVKALRANGLGLVVDIVPNHMGVAVPAANPAWWDVLTHGRESRYAHWFDIDWSRGRLLIPVLGNAAALEELTVADGELRYYDHRFPISPGTAGGTPQEVHERQQYELVDWRRGNTEINYRRFFAIAELAAVRVEDPDVFEATHRELLRWHAAGELDGIRVDHPDGLRDPGGYLRDLAAAAPGAWIVVEKILEPGEDLPDWPVAGTTGYDALGEACGLFVDPSAEAAFTSIAGPVDWPGLVHDAKFAAATELLAAELSRLVALSPVPVERAAVAETAAAFGVYRSYLPVGFGHLEAALSAARARRPDLDFDTLGRRLRDETSELAIRFQQYTGAVMAKGVEDTAFYRWTRFTALNEVGGDPARFGVPPADFHAAQVTRQARWPETMTTLSTHDTKRGEDVRARLAVLSERPEDWAAVVRRWHAAAPIPDAAHAHLLWQSVAGTWPIEPERLHAYIEKAAREASTHTSWADPNAEFEGALHDAVDAAYGPLKSDIDAFVAAITPHGWSNSLGQKIVQLLMPGVPDVYQGTELWDNSLVDPDNRRPVDFHARRELLGRLDGGWLPPVDATGAAKLLVVSRALRIRRERELSGYRPLMVTGEAARHLVAFDRGGVVALATRLPVGLRARGGWADTTVELPPGRWTDALTGRPVDGVEPVIRDLLSVYPVALLVRE